MPAFAESSGGMLTDQQVESIVNGMIDHWGKPGILNGTQCAWLRTGASKAMCSKEKPHSRLFALGVTARMEKASPKRRRVNLSCQF